MPGPAALAAVRCKQLQRTKTGIPWRLTGHAAKTDEARLKKTEIEPKLYPAVL
jgi:hypothetical protein